MVLAGVLTGLHPWNDVVHARNGLRKSQVLLKLIVRMMWLPLEARVVLLDVEM